MKFLLFSLLLLSAIFIPVSEIYGITEKQAEESELEERQRRPSRSEHVISPLEESFKTSNLAIDYIYRIIQGWGANEKSAVYYTRAALIFILLLFSFISNYIAKKLMLGVLRKGVKHSKNKWDDIFVEKKVFERFSHLAPALAIYLFSDIVFAGLDDLNSFVKRLCMAYMALAGFLVFSAFLVALTEVLNRTKRLRNHPVKAYLQVLKVFAFLLTAILVIASLLDKSPWVFLGGLTGLTAVMMLVFKDSILGFVASIQIATNKMVRHGDWIEMPKYGADGDVIDISINTIKVQNWDKTITTIPTYALISDSFKNWRGMSESGGRRIKRAIHLDMLSVRFLSDEEHKKFKSFEYLKDYLTEKENEISEHNKENKIDDSILANGRRLTNLGTFRAYLERYLKAHPKIHNKMTFLVRQLTPNENGLPIEIYVFSNDQNWNNYEAIQADIFDHLLAVIPEFGLRVFQNPSGADFRSLSK